MQKVKMLELLRRGIRQRVCVQCYCRPEGSESQASGRARMCEDQCPIFRHLPQIARTTRPIRGENLGPYERGLREAVCQGCEASPTAGDFCTEAAHARCPLRRYMAEVVDVVERMDEMRRHRAGSRQMAAQRA